MEQDDEKALVEYVHMFLWIYGTQKDDPKCRQYVEVECIDNFVDTQLRILCWFHTVQEPVQRQEIDLAMQPHSVGRSFFRLDALQYAIANPLRNCQILDVLQRTHHLLFQDKRDRGDSGSGSVFQCYEDPSLALTSILDVRAGHQETCQMKSVDFLAFECIHLMAVCGYLCCFLLNVL